MDPMLSNPEPDRAGLRTLRRDHFVALMPSTTRWADNDSYGHLNNAVYSELFDTALDAWVVSLAGEVMHVLGISTVVFLREVSHPAELEVGIAVNTVGRTSAQMLLALFAAGHDEPAAVCAWTDIFVDADTRHPVSVPDAIRAVPLLRSRAEPANRPAGPPTGAPRTWSRAS